MIVIFTMWHIFEERVLGDVQKCNGMESAHKQMGGITGLHL